MTLDLPEQISRLRKNSWVNLQGLIDCSTTHISSPASRPSCSSISLLGRGSYNTVYQLDFTDGTRVAASVSVHDEEDFNPQAKQSEIATLKFVRESGLYPDIPVPKIHGWDVTFNNPACAPYVVMDIVQGKSLQDLQLSHVQQLSMVRSLAKLKASLSRPVPFEEIGSIAVGAEGGKHSVGPLITLTQGCLRGPFKCADELWRSCLEKEMLHAVEEWCNLEEDQLSTSLSEPNCTPQTFSELFQLLSALIPHFKIPQAYNSLVLHHPDLALRNVFFDEESLSSDQLKITGVIDWAGTQILPLMLTAQYPDDIMTSADDPFSRPDYPDENWHTVPVDWTSTGDATQWPQAFGLSDEPIDYAPRVKTMVRRFYLRTYFSACYAEQLHRLHGDMDLSRATLFAYAPYYLKFHETICGGWTNWVEHAGWIRETYWRLRAISGQITNKESLIIGPNVYRGSIEAPLLDLRIFNESTRSGDTDGDSD